MKNYFLLVFLILFGINAKSQIVFHNVYDIDTLHNSLRTQIELDNGDFIAGKGAFLHNESYTYLERIDNFGETVWKKNINMNERNFSSLISIVNIDNNIYITGVNTDTTYGNYESYFLKMSLDGDSIYSKVYHDTINSAAQKILYKDNHFYILKWIAGLSPYTDVDSRIIKIDTFGNIVENWNYDSNNLNAISDFKHTEAGDNIVEVDVVNYTSGFYTFVVEVDGQLVVSKHLAVIH